jgi:hypothetical protein
MGATKKGKIGGNNIFLQLNAEKIDAQQSKKSSMSFTAVSRKKHHQTFVKPNEDDIRVARFNPTYKHTDGERHVRTYGTASKWDNHMFEQSKRLKN